MCLKNTLIFASKKSHDFFFYQNNDKRMWVKMPGTVQLRGERKETVINF